MASKSETIALRTAIKALPRLELELKGRISEILRQYNVPISDALLTELVFATADEIDASVMVTLPRPTLPPLAIPEDNAATMTPTLPQPTLPPI